VEKEIAVRIQRISTFLEAHFGDVDVVEGNEINEEEPGLIVRVDDSEARIDLVDMVSLFSTTASFVADKVVLECAQLQRPA
jgi:hypothetical protein